MSRIRKEPVSVIRRRILSAARLVMVKNGYHDFRIKDLAAKADIATGTVYLYFKDKDVLLAHIFTDLLDQVDERIRTAAKNAKSADIIDHIVRTVFSFMDENQDFLFQFTGEQSALMQTKSAKALRDRYKHHLSLLAGIFSALMKKKLLRPYPPLAAAMHFSYLSRMYMIQKILFKTSRPLIERSQEFMDLFMLGMGSGRARRE